MNLQVLAYGIYLAVTLFVTIYVARTLFNNGRAFLVDIFQHNNELADSVNKLLVVGFYLINFGYAVFVMGISADIENYRMLMEVLSKKVGFIVLLLGAMHFFNLFVFFKLRKKAQEHNLRAKIFQGE